MSFFSHAAPRIFEKKKHEKIYYQAGAA